MKNKCLISFLLVMMIIVTGCSNEEQVISENPKDVTMENVEIGAYVEYKPSNTQCIVSKAYTGVEENQIFDPSSVTSWKVFKNNNGQLDIISSESVGDLTLYGAKSYIGAIDILNDMCNEYVNPLYADKGRCLGYVEDKSIGAIKTSTYPLTWSHTYSKGNTGEPYTDSYYKTDLEIINTSQNSFGGLKKAYPLKHSNGEVWLASRNLIARSSDSFFYVRKLTSDGNNSENYLYIDFAEGNAYSKPQTCGIRPVISLKPEIKIIGGSGTKDNPYVISN